MTQSSDRGRMKVIKRLIETDPPTELTAEQIAGLTPEQNAEYEAARRQRRIDIGIPTLEDHRIAEAERAAKPRAQNVCECGCGGSTHSRFTVGHDSKHKSALLARHDAGDESATAELIERGWRTAEALAARDGRAKGEKRTAAERTAAKVARMDGQLASLRAERARLMEMYAAHTRSVEGSAA